MASLVIKNGRIVGPVGMIYGGLAVENGTIIHIGSNASLPSAKRVIDAQDNLVIPGLIDPHVHLGHGRQGTIEDRLRGQFPTESEGALHGGVTTLGHFVSEVQGKPLVPTFELTRKLGESLSFVDFFLHAIMIDEDHVAEQEELFKLGVTSFKHFFNTPTWRERAGAKVAYCDEGVLFRSLENIAGLGQPAIGMTHCEEMSIINVLIDQLREAGRDDLQAWAEARPPFVEAMRIQHAFEIAKAANAPLYILHIASAAGVDLVAEWRRQGHRVWGETLVAYLTHTSDMEEQIGCWGKNNPAIKSKDDRDRLWRGIAEGSISTVGTDHLTVPLEEKEGGRGKHHNIWASTSGLCGGMEHLLPAMMTFGVNAGRISIEDMVRVSSSNAAKIFGLYPRKGVLAPGSDADIVIVDPAKEMVVGKGFYHCQSDFSIYQGWRMKGFAKTTILRGQVMMDEYETIGAKGIGRFIPCGYPR